MISRLLGFARDMLFAYLFGVSAGTDAFFVAFKIPNFLRRLFAEGAFAQAFVPVLTDYKQNAGREDLKTFIDKTAGTLTVLLFGVSVLGIVAAPVVITLFAPGFLAAADRYDLAVEMLRITFPYLLFISMTAFAGGILNAHGKFAIPAVTPVFLNLCMILAAIFCAPWFAEPMLALSWGVFVAGAVQLAFQIPALSRLGLLPRLRWGWRDAGVRRIIKLMVPAMFSVSVVQINLLFDTFMASFLDAGSVSWLYYSDRLVEFPLGIFGVAVATVILPYLSDHHASDDIAAFSKSMDWGLKVVMAIGLPATVGLVMLAKPVIYTLFRYNEFEATDAYMAARSLMAFALGLLAFMLIKVLVPGFTSREDTGSPVRFGVYAVICNVVLNLALIHPYAHAGVALATSLAAYLNAGMLWFALWRRGIHRPDLSWWIFLLRVILASAVMGLFLFYFVDNSVWLAWGAWQRGLHLAGVIFVAILAYVVTLLVLGIRPRHLMAR